MATYIARRLILALIVLVIITLMIFLVIRYLPGDPILLYMSRQEQQTLTQDQIDAARHQFGLDRPIVVQYFSWINGIFHGNFGDSLFYSESVGAILKRRIPVTLNLGIPAFIIGSILGTAAGVLSAIKRGKALDSLMAVFSYVGIAVPVFWLGVLLIYVFGLKANLLPMFGYVSPTTNLADNIKHLILPVACLVVTPLASISRQSRSSMLEIIRQDYIRTAWAKGLRERNVVMRHALKNGLIPVVTLMGISLSYILGGSVFIETVFSIPGMGALSVSALLSKDYAIIQAITLLIAGMIVIVNLLVDLTYGWLDPRIRYS
ncbi:MAG TPA: ABC transporter permease [Dehalococcoidales bacterium]|nr:ABC transporter permease [Dehalococcoidales bacterium]